MTCFYKMKKKGCGNNYQRMKEVNLLNCSWYYNWESKKAPGNGSAVFIPMNWGIDDHVSNPNGFLLGYNEPDNPHQGNIPVEKAYQASKNWKAKTMISPGMAGEPTRKDRPWFKKFIALGATFDAMAYHHYGNVNPDTFIASVQHTYNMFKKPIWVTEFAPQTHADAASSPHKYSQAQVDNFIIKSLTWMEATPWISGYAYHDPRNGVCALFTEDGKMTPSGKTYAKFISK